MDPNATPTTGADAPVLFEEMPAGRFRIGIATLNRPRQINALNLEMCQMLLDRLRAWRADQGIAAVLLKGAGERGFCAGGDVSEVVRHIRAGGDQRFVYGDAFFEVEYTLDRLIHRFGKPLVSYAHGVHMGGGLGLTAGASHRIVSEGSRIAMPEIHIGLFPDVGGGYFLNRVPGAAGTVMALTGLTINEADALFAGLADYFLPMEALPGLIDSLAGLPWQGEPAADRIRLTEHLRSMSRRFMPGLPVSNLRQYFDAIRYIGLMPTAAAMRDALAVAAGEDPYFEPAARALAEGSPTAARVSFEYLARSRRQSLEEVLAMDLTLARRFQRLHDFPEGVRALLIDKDRKPRWSPDRIEAVDEALVQAHFAD
jgi:enoyl-CoA hydratase/carnithine racemase